MRFDTGAEVDTEVVSPGRGCGAGFGAAAGVAEVEEIKTADEVGVESLPAPEEQVAVEREFPFGGSGAAVEKIVVGAGQPPEGVRRHGAPQKEAGAFDVHVVVQAPAQPVFLSG